MKKIIFAILFLVIPVTLIAYSSAEAYSFELSLNPVEQKIYDRGERIGLVLTITNTDTRAINAFDEFRFSSTMIIDEVSYRNEPNDWSAEGDRSIWPSQTLKINFAVSSFTPTKDILTNGKHTVAIRIGENTSNAITIEVAGPEPGNVDITTDKVNYRRGEKLIITVSNNDSKREIYYPPQVACGLSFWVLEEYKLFKWSEFKYQRRCLWVMPPPYVKLEPNSKITKTWDLTMPGMRLGMLTDEFIGPGRYRLRFYFLVKNADDPKRCDNDKKFNRSQYEFCPDKGLIYTNEFTVW
ncbi:MAG: hypothetical protein FJZ11_02220 [Candidatus Omnitrophica bacterium]|nr:hypothetical protein [Candidatus Omnitrophota bacterium]